MNDQGAMNLTFGDLLILQHAILAYTRNIDMTTLAGQHLQELLGKVEYQMRSIQANERPHVSPDVKSAGFPAPGK